MYCPKCGFQIEGNFCSKCGTPIYTKGKINITRNNNFVGGMIDFTVYVDNMLLGKLKMGQTLSCDVTLGMHTISLKSIEKTVIQNVSLNENQNEVTIQVSPKMGLITARPNIKEIIYKNS